MQKMLQSIRTVVFAGGGIRGLAFVGALQELRDAHGIDFGARSPKIDTVSGVSVGTLFALMICLGYSVAELTDFASTMRQSDVVSSDPVRILSGELSFDDGSKLRSRVEELLIRKKYPTNITLIQLRQKTDMLFHCVVTDLTTAKVVHIDANSHPDLQVATAMVASMTVPTVYPPILSPDGHYWVDGGILENFPMMRFNPETLIGFNFKVAMDCEIDTLFTFIARVLHVQNVPMEAAAWSLMSEAHKDRCVVIDAGKNSTLRLLDLSPEERLTLLMSGRAAIKRKIEEWNGSKPRNSLEPHKGPDGLPTYLASLKTCSPEPRAHP
jgi:predicted acylesterase/phospholipase RssA